MAEPMTSRWRRSFAGLRARPAVDRLAVTCGLVALAWHAPARAQDAGSGERSWSIQSAASIRQIVTDNYLLTTPREGDAITELGAGLRVAMQGRQLHGSLDYQLTGLLYGKHSDQNAARHQLSANALAEVIDGQGYVDVRAGVSERTLSAFGSLSTDGLRPSTNRDRVYSFTLMPYIIGRVSNLFDYRVQAGQDITRFRDTPGFGMDRTTVRFGLVGENVPFGWALDGDHRRTRYKGADYQAESQLKGTARYRVNQDMRLGASAGVESSDFNGDDNQSRSTYGLYLDWTPSERTALHLATERHYYGTSHGVDLTYRTERLVLTFSDKRDLSDGSLHGIPSTGDLGQLIARQFLGTSATSAQTDFAVRDFLRANGVDPDAQAISGFAANAASVGRTQTLSAVWRGLRTTMSLRLAQGWSRQLEGITGPVTDFQLSRILRQRGIVGDISYSPSPVSSIGLNGTWQRNSGDDSAPTTELKSVGVSGSIRPSTQSEWTAGLRYSVFNSPTEPYRERAGYLGYRLQF
jgi:uncharacterized protein (PEP-CTERM system associated)